jgi:ParB family chromosome partitioning protein
VPCHVKELSDREAFEIALIENVQRETLNPIDEARAYARYVKEFGWGAISELARRLGKSQSYVSHRILLLELPLDVQEKVSSRQLNPSTATELLWLEDERRRMNVAGIAIADRLSAKQVRRLVAEVRAGRRGLDPLDFPSRSTEAYVANRLPALLRRLIVLYRTTLIRLDGLVEDTEESSLLREFLMEQRRILHGLLDAAIREECRCRRYQSRAVMLA